jgi:hypothetical protein
MKMPPAIKRLQDKPIVRFGMLLLGCLLMIAAPLVSPLPGPGGIIVFALGLGMALRNSLWAKRRYVRFKRKRPKVGSTIDWWMRKRSRQRSRRAKVAG